ncbi:IS66 family insertion sequence element accessory protein TnpA [Ruminococcus albus]|uniref:IS66 family insertion sequence element accessory protein TnpA n=1 Tax=Ruminococcus albus TaxID=1264 RepID=UPI001D14812A|nr:IS66 family insertion sequence element accessory protein TnpB [Ruminococcus albus]MCC3350784.1 IS66 family insertion sequence element accessory protein TnpB [Ruminococcus albus 8]
MQSNTTSITTIKQEVRLQEWSAQIEAQQASGLTIREWCKENGIKPNTYYNRLRKVREQYMEKSPTVVPVSVPRSSENIRIEKNGLQISLPTDISPEVLLALVKELC